VDVGLLRAELELDATQFRRDVDQAGNQFRALAQEADRAAQNAASAFNRAGQQAAQASGNVESAWQQAGSQAEAAASGIQGAWSQAGSQAEAAASGIGGEWQQAGSQAESAASGIGGAFQQAGSQAESAASGIGGAFENAGAQGEQAASGIGGAFSSAMESAAGSADGAGASGGGAFIASFGTRVASLGSKAGPIGLALGATVGIGALAGAKLADSVYDGFQIQAERDFTQAQFGLNDYQMTVWGEAAGNAFGNAWGESVSANLDTAGVALQAGLIDGNATAAEMQPLIEQLNFVSGIMGEEIPAVARAAGQMIKTGMVETPLEAMDLLTAAQQRGLNMSEDIIDTMVEYGTQFRKVGIDGQTAMGLIAQAVQGGARDTDIAADAIKEFSLRAIDGSESTTEAFTTLGEVIGMTAEEMQTELGKGGDAAFGMTDKILDALGEIEDPIKRNELAIALFGTQVEDLGGAFDTMDLSTAAAGFDATGKALEGMDIAGGGAAASLEAARNKISVAADEVKVKLAEAFAPMASDAATWVTENQDQILNFFIELAAAAITVSAALLDVASTSMSAAAGIERAFAGALRTVVDVIETIGEGMSHVPGPIGDAGRALQDFAKNADDSLDKIDAHAEGVQKGADIAARLADELREGKITLEQYQAGMMDATGAVGNMGQATGLVTDTVVALNAELAALPRDHPIAISAPGGQGVFDLLTQLGVKVTTDNNKNIVVESPLAPDVLAVLQQLGVSVRNDNGKNVIVTTNAPAAKVDVDNLNTSLREIDGKVVTATAYFDIINRQDNAKLNNQRGLMTGSGRAGGGPISGPGGPKDDMILTPTSDGEWVMQASAVDMYGEEFMAMVNAGMLGVPRADGGPVSVLDSLQTVQQQAAPTLTLTSGVRDEPGSYHNTGQAGDFGPPGGGRDTDDMLAFANYMADNYRGQLAELIYHDSRFSGRQVGDGAFVDDSYYAGAGDHHDHVHVAAEQPLSAPAGMDPMPPAEIEVPVLSTDSSKEEVARAIIAQGRKRGYTDEEIKAILATGMQESGLSPTANGGGGAWHGVFQQDESYAGRDDPNQNIDEFYNRLDEKHKGEAGGDIWEDIFWLQQRPGDTSGASAVANGRQGYLTEIQSQSDDAGALFDQVAPSVGTVPAAPGDPGVGAPTGVQQVYVVGGRLDGAPVATTPAATSTPSAPAPAAAAPPEVFGRGPLPIVAYANGGTIPGVGNEDSELILGMPGEEIIRKGPAEEWRPLLKAINSGKIRKFAAGGTVGFGGYSEETSDFMKPENFYDWAALAVGGAFTAASVAMPYVNMALGKSVNLGSILPTMDTSANSVDGVSQMVGKVADEVVKQLIEIQRAVREEGAKVHPTDPNSGAGLILGAAGL
jgi:hypothetical protein